MTPSLSEKIEAVREIVRGLEEVRAFYEDPEPSRKLLVWRGVLQSLEGMQKLEEAARAVVAANDTANSPEDLIKILDAIDALRAVLPDPLAAAETMKD